VLIELAQWAGVSQNGRSEYRALNLDELKTLGDSGLVEIGSHTVTHSVLSARPPDVRRKEIVQSKGYLEEILGRPVDSFSYPYGGARDVGEDTIQLVSEAGYKVACANFAAFVTRKSNPYWLPRYLIRDWDGEEFTRRLRRWFCG
jgi:peptidoglycan/xylan/chitin deacetylase (PgdA/CDA1 family)